jgi:hypothetical protein
VSPSETANVALAVADVLILPVAVFAAADAARSFERGNAARMSWGLLAAGLALFWAGEAIEAAYTLGGRKPPFPSAGDPFFLLGYTLLVRALFLFLRAYRASGLGDDGARATLATSLLVAAFGLPVLVPMVRTAAPLGERLVGGAYVVLDLVALVPLLLLLRLASRLWGGLLWQVWASLLFGFLLTFAGDVIVTFGLAVADEASAARLDLASSVVFTLSYLAIARGTWCQRRLLRQH